MTGSPLTASALLAAAVATIAIGAYGVRLSRTTSDFLVASRTVGPQWNAAAISGEYLSAASFLGVAGLIAKYGADALWYPVGFTAGYLGLLLFVAAPLRRSGAYTVPDFAEFRLGSARLRKVAMLVVVVICVYYLVPQYQGAGLALKTLLGVPVWIGPLVVGGIVITNVVAGGMRSITFVQAFQYWLKLTAASWADRCRRPSNSTRRSGSKPTWWCRFPIRRASPSPARSTAGVSTRRRSRRRGNTPSAQALPCRWPPVLRLPWWQAPPAPAPTGSPPVAASAAAIRSIKCCRSSSQPSWAPWVYRTCWCAFTPTPTDARLGAPRWRSSRCCRCSICSPRCWAPSPGCPCRSC